MTDLGGRESSISRLGAYSKTSISAMNSFHNDSFSMITLPEHRNPSIILFFTTLAGCVTPVQICGT